MTFLANIKIAQEISNDLSKQSERLCINFFLLSQFPNIVMGRIIDSCGNIWKLIEEYPFAKKKPGPLSFRLGKLKFKQLVWDRERNRKPFKFKPGPLSFRIGPIRFNQIPQKHLLQDPCCYDPLASCYLLAYCDGL